MNESTILVESQVKQISPSPSSILTHQVHANQSSKISFQWESSISICLGQGSVADDNIHSSWLKQQEIYYALLDGFQNYFVGLEEQALSEASSKNS